MKKLFGVLLALVSTVAFAATTVPVQLLNPAGSTSGQAILSNGPSSAPTWQSVTLGILPTEAANTLLGNASASSATPSAVAVPSCSTSASGLQWTSGTGFACNTAINAATLGGATFAAPGAIGGTTPAAGTFTTLAYNSGAKLQYTNASGQSIPSGTATTITTWTAVFDVNSNFNASTGTFTAPANGKYLVSGQITWNIPSGATALSQYQIQVVVSGTVVYTGIYVVPSAPGAATIAQVPFSILVNVSSSGTVVVKALQATGSTQTLNSGATFNTLSIVQTP